MPLEVGRVSDRDDVAGLQLLQALEHRLVGGLDPGLVLVAREMDRESVRRGILRLHLDPPAVVVQDLARDRAGGPGGHFEMAMSSRGSVSGPGESRTRPTVKTFLPVQEQPRVGLLAEDILDRLILAVEPHLHPVGLLLDHDPRGGDLAGRPRPTSRRGEFVRARRGRRARPAVLRVASAGLTGSTRILEVTGNFAPSNEPEPRTQNAGPCRVSSVLGPKKTESNPRLVSTWSVRKSPFVLAEVGEVFLGLVELEGRAEVDRDPADARREELGPDVQLVGRVPAGPGGRPSGRRGAGRGRRRPEGRDEEDRQPAERRTGPPGRCSTPTGPARPAARGTCP